MATTPEVITTIRDVVVASAAIFTASVAWRGISKWRDELTGKTEFETAFNLAKATYKLRDELRRCRAPIVMSSEFPSETASESDKWAHILQNRAAPVGQAMSDFDAHSLAAEALWGSEFRSKPEAVRKCVGELYSAMHALVDDQAANGEHFKQDPEFAKSIRRKVFCSPGSRDNPLEKQIEAAVKGIEDYVRPHLKRPQ